MKLNGNVMPLIYDQGFKLLSWVAITLGSLILRTNVAPATAVAIAI